MMKNFASSHSKYSTLLALGVCGVLIPSDLPAQAGTLDNIRQSISSLWSRKSGKQEKARSAISKARQLDARSEHLHEKLEKAQQTLAKSNAVYFNYTKQLKKTEAQIVKTRHRVQISAERYNRRRILFGRRLAAMQRSGKISYLQVFLGSRTLSDLTRRAHFVETVTERDAQLLQELKADKDELFRLQNSLYNQREARLELQRAAFNERKRALLATQAQEQAWKKMRRNVYAQLAYARAEQQSSREIYDMISRLETKRSGIISANEARARRAAANRYARAERYEMPVRGGRFDGHSNGDGWAMPVRGRLSSRFGMRFHPVIHRYKLHTGQDIAAPNGTPFRAARGGIVLYAGWKAAYGNTIIISHGNGTQTLYGHASSLAVSSGQRVRTGQYIGNVGSTGWSTGPHLHFEVLRGGRPVDPMRYVG